MGARCVHDQLSERSGDGLMSVSFHFRDSIVGSDWNLAHGYVLSEFDYLYAGLGPIGPLIDSLIPVSGSGYSPTSGLLTTDTAGKPVWQRALPGPLQFVPASVLEVQINANQNDY